MAQVQPVYGPNYSQLLSQGLQAYGQVKGIQRQDQQYERQQEQDAIAKQDRDDLRFRRERALAASEIQNLPVHKQLEVLKKRVIMVNQRGGDSSNTQGMVDLLEGSPEQQQEAQGYIRNSISQGEREGFLKAPAGTASITASQKDLIAAGYKPGTPEFEQAMKDKMAGGEETQTTLYRNVVATGLKPGTPEFQTEMKKQLTKPEKGASATSLEKNLILAGYEPGTPEFAAEVKKYLTKSQGGINIDLGQGSEKRELGKLRAQRYQKVTDAADVAQNNIASLDVLDNIDVSTGKAEPMKQNLAAWGQSLGINTDKLANVAAGEAFTAEASKVVLNAMAAQKGPQTESDMRQIRTTVSGLGKTPEANKFINNSARALSRRAIEQRDFYDNYFSEKDTLKGASKAWNDFKRDVPMISNKLKSPEGLPIFYFQFKDEVLAANPGASDQQVLEVWQAQHQKGK